MVQVGSHSDQIFHLCRLCCASEMARTKSAHHFEFMRLSESGGGTFATARESVSNEARWPASTEQNRCLESLLVKGLLGPAFAEMKPSDRVD